MIIMGSFSRRPYKECHQQLYGMIYNLDQYNVVHLSNIRNIDQSETFFVIIQWIRCCVKCSFISSGSFSRRPYKECH